jgi:hypothetical protein
MPQTKRSVKGAPSPGGAKKTSRKGIRPVDRQKMKDWLIDKLSQKELPDHLWWVAGKEGREFFVRWPHAARQGFSAGDDAKLFRAWAIHSGRC